MRIQTSKQGLSNGEITSSFYRYVGVILVVVVIVSFGKD